MKKILISAAMVSVTFAFAQKKEIQNAVKAIESNDIATANAEIAKAESLLGGKTYLLEPSVLEQYYYTKGLALLKSGKSLEGAVYLGKINDLGKSTIFTGKDANKQKVHFVGKEAADQSGIAGLKQEKYQTTTTEKLVAIINPIIIKYNKEAVDEYNSKNYASAGDKFKIVYNLLKSAGSQEFTSLLNAASSYERAKNYHSAAETYKELIDNKYTGITTLYTAKNKKSGEVENLNEGTWKTFKQLGAASDYTDFKTETTPSVEKDIYDGIARSYFNAEKYDDVITYADQGLAKFPNDADLLNLKGLAFHKSGKSAEFIKNLKEQIAKNPNDADSYYNLGVLTRQDDTKQEEAIGYFKKAIELKPNNKDAYQNLTFITIGDDAKAIEAIDKAKKAKNMDLFNKLLDERRERFKKAVPYAEKWYELDPKNLDAVSMLKGLYQSTHNDVKAAEMKKVEAALSAGK